MEIKLRCRDDCPHNRVCWRTTWEEPFDQPCDTTVEELTNRMLSNRSVKHVHAQPGVTGLHFSVSAQRERPTFPNSNVWIEVGRIKDGYYERFEER